MRVNSRQSERRNSLRHGADQLHAACLQGKHRCGHNAADNDKKRDRFVLEKDFSKNEQRQRACSNQKGHRVRFVQVLEKVARVSPKTAMSTMKTEKLWQLRAGKEKRHAAFESGHNTL